jgi:tetratricopeptide (TPR) repeat protein
MLCLFVTGGVSANRPYDNFAALYDTLVGSHYEAAWQIYDRMEQDGPDDPATLFARATILYTAMVDFEDTTGEAEFFSCCDAVVEACGEQVLSAEEDEHIWLQFLHGSSLATRAFYIGRLGRTWPALKLLLKARSIFSRILEEDPTFHDARLGRGVYRWGAAKHVGLLAGLPFLPTRGQALADIRLAVDSSRFSRHAAASALAWVLVRDRQYTEAESLINCELERFPNARSFLWPLIALQYHTGRFRECIASAEELVAQYLVLPRNNGYDVVGLHKRMAEAAMKLDDQEAVLRFCRAGLAASMTSDARERRRRDLEILEKWQEKAQRRLRKNDEN